MLDINQFIEEKGGNPELIRQSQKARYASVELVDDIIADYKDWVKTRFELDELNKKLNKLQKDIGLKFKNKEDPKELLAEKDEITAQKAKLTEQEQADDKDLKEKIMQVGNIVHPSVVISNDEDNNELVRTWKPEDLEEVGPVASVTGKPAKLSHHEILLRLDGYDPERGVKISGHRGFFLRNYGVFLNQASFNQLRFEFLGPKGLHPITSSSYDEQGSYG